MRLPAAEWRWPYFLILLLTAHIIWGTVRIPSRVYGRRLDNIERYLEKGAAGYHLDNNHRQGAAIVDKILAETEADCIILWRGKWRGCLEFVPALVAPRLLVAEDSVLPQADSYLERPIAVGELDGGKRGVLVLIGGSDHLDLQLR